MTKVVREQFATGKRRVNGYRKWKDTQIERILRAALDQAHIDHRNNYPINLGDFTTFPDVYIPAIKLCIYADGEYWHNYPLGNERDIQANITLPLHGYQVVRFWGKDIYKDVQACVSRIQEMIQSELAGNCKSQAETS